MAAISDSSPLILFAKISRLGLLQRLFDEILIPPAVADEIFTGRTGHAEATAIAAAAWIRVQPVKMTLAADVMSSPLGKGEIETIGLGIEHQGRLAVIMDDRAGRRAAHERGQSVIGSAGVLILAKEIHAITTVREPLQRLRLAGLYLSETVFHEVLALAGE